MSKSFKITPTSISTVPVVSVSNPNRSAPDIVMSLNFSSGYSPKILDAKYFQKPIGAGRQHLTLTMCCPGSKGTIPTP